MSLSLVVPIVTEEDLLTFHSRTFGKEFKVAGAIEAGFVASDDKYEHAEEDDLGYYPDGAKRTLTNQEIEIFRHSEIHALLRQKELEAEEAAESQSEGEIVDTAENHQSPSKDSKVSAAGASVISEDDAVLDDDKDDDEEYARFLEQERKEFAKTATRLREKRRTSQGQDVNDRMVSTRRKVREMDAVANADVVLDY